MPYVEPIPPADAGPALRREYDAAQRRAGRIWGIVAIQSHHPAALRDSIRLYSTVMFGESPLSRAQREMIAVVTSQANDCVYWIQAHLHDLRSEVDDQDMVDRFAADWRTAGLDAATHALLAFAEKLTRRPADCGAADIDALRAGGLTDRAVNDAVQVCAYFNYINRIAEGLGVAPEDWIDETGRRRS